MKRRLDRKVVCVSLYRDDIDLITALVLSARESDPRASRSGIIRNAIRKYADGGDKVSGGDSAC